MAQGDRVVNSDVETYLDYYCKLSHAPGFAILLKGQWGAGKTWFINKYSEKLKDRDRQCLYISLYGMSTLSEIDDKFFELLHPILSSPGMAITGKIIKGLLKLGLKIDLNADQKDEGTWNIQVPEISLPKHLKNINESILIFDDLERCNIELGNLLGYINSFVEHQELKVVIVANEDELIKKDKNYQIIKEKLIGRTFGIFPDFERALENFIAQTGNTNVRSFLSENVQVIKDLYDQAEYENLRNLKVIVLDFERIFEAMPEKARSKPEILKDVLKLLIAFSIEIKRGLMLPEDINKLPEEYKTALSKLVPSRQTASSVTQDKDEESNFTS
jgi:GTPase SAR1 family protein